MTLVPRRGDQPATEIRMLELLVCPLTKGPLIYDADRNALVSTSGRLAYPIRDGIPIMLPSEATRIDAGND